MPHSIDSKIGEVIILIKGLNDQILVMVTFRNEKRIPITANLRN